VGPPPHPGPAVPSDGNTALHWAACGGNRRMIRLLVDANAAVNAQEERRGCAVCARGESAVECAGRVAAAVGRAGGRRCTMPRTKAILHASRSCCCAAPTRPSRTAAGTAALRRTAETETRNSRARAGARRSDPREVRRSSQSTRRERGRCTPPPPHRPPPLPPFPPSPFPTLLVPTDVPSVLAVGVRRSCGQGCDATLALKRAPSPRASWCTIAPAGRSVQHDAREPLLPLAAQSAHAHAVLCRA
jgi:hypothetical protein